MVVVLPAPFGPKSPKISPSLKEKEILLTAVKPPNFLVKFFTVRMFITVIISALCHSESEGNQFRTKNLAKGRLDVPKRKITAFGLDPSVSANRRIPQDDINSVIIVNMINVMKTAAEKAGRVLLKYFAKNLVLNFKSSHQNFYTVADLESQKIIKETIANELVNKDIRRSEIGCIGEENLHEASKKHLFIIDPLDGTTNFTSGWDYFAVSIAYCLNGQTLSGVVYKPSTHDFYTAVRSKGTYKNEKRLSLSPKPMKECLLDGFISSFTPVYPKLFKVYKNIFPHTKGFRSSYWK